MACYKDAKGALDKAVPYCSVGSDANQKGLTECKKDSSLCS